MNLDTITNDPIGPALKAFGLPFTPENQTKMRRALEAALPYVVAKQDIKIKMLDEELAQARGDCENWRKDYTELQGVNAGLRSQVVALTAENEGIKTALVKIADGVQKPRFEAYEALKKAAALAQSSAGEAES